MYEPKALTTTIKATSKVTLNLSGNRGKNNFYSVEYTEERTVPAVEGVDLQKEREALWNDVNDIVDTQAQEIVKTFSQPE